MVGYLKRKAIFSNCESRKLTIVGRGSKIRVLAEADGLRLVTLVARPALRAWVPGHIVSLEEV